MPTKLDKEISRETDVIKDKRNLIVSLTPEQTIKLKPKGLRGNNGIVEVSIDELWDSKSGKKSLVEKVEKKERKQSDDDGQPIVNLYWLRSQSAISGLPVADIAKFDGIIKNLIDEWYTEKKR
jgi:hypothetical protein